MTVPNSTPYRGAKAALVSLGIVMLLTTACWALSGAEVSQLARDQIVVTDEAFKQVFEAYQPSIYCYFVTSDSLLNGYHVLYEESILRLEQANASKMPDVLRGVLDRLDAISAEAAQQEPELLSAAKQRATLVLGIALKLLNDGFSVDDADAMAIIGEEVARIVTAQGTMKPAWLGPPESDFVALDYSRYRVRGFYTRTDSLTRYFRAVAWLQSIPFRVSHDDELLSILILGRCLASDGSEADDARYASRRMFFRTYTEFLGVGDDWDLVMAADATADGLDFDLDAKRAELIAQAEDGPQINDQLRFAPDDPNAVAEPNFRIISAYRLPEAVLFQRTADIRKFRGRAFPNGLEVCIALGSTFARDKLEDAQKASVVATIDENQDLFSGTSLYFDYLRMIRTLLDAPEPNAPFFMLGEPWQAKSCGTALAGWAQLRHTWMLQAKLNVASFGAVRGIPTGFVESEPEFFRRMADLAARTRGLLEVAGAFETNYFSLIDALTDLADLLDQCATEEEFGQRIAELPDDEHLRLGHLRLMLSWPASDDVPEEEWTAAMADWLRGMADDLGEGIVDPILAGFTWMYESDVAHLWSLLETTSCRLESIARTQLAGGDLDEDDDNFIKGYGGTLAAIMGYDGNYSAEHPKDDAPRIADIYSNPEVGGNLHVGVGRARAIYVLYPWEGQNLLCRGAVMPYYEFVDSGRLTDEDWKARLDSDARPDVPAWLRPIISETGLSAPDFSASDGR